MTMLYIALIIDHRGEEQWLIFDALRHDAYRAIALTRVKSILNLVLLQRKLLFTAKFLIDSARFTD